MRAEKAAFIDETCSVACSTSIGDLHEPIYAPFELRALGQLLQRGSVGWANRLEEASLPVCGIPLHPSGREHA